MNTPPVQSRTTTANRLWPKAALLAMLMVGVIEFGLRFMPAEHVIRTDLGTTEYLAVRAAIQTNMTREFVFAGSSRALQGIVLEDFSDALHRRAPGDWRVGSYAINGALSAETISVLRFLLEHPRQPRVIAWGLSIDEIRGDDIVSDRSMLYYPLGDYVQERRQLGREVAPYWPDAVRAELSEISWLYRFHFLPVIYIKDMGRPCQPRPFLGESFGRHSADEGVLEDTQDLRTAIRDRYRKWGFYEDDFHFSERKLNRIRETLRECKRHGIQVCLFEVPNAPPFNIELPPRLHVMIRKTLADLATETGAPMIWARDMGVDFETTDFYDTVHLNFEGAKRLTLALAEQMPQVVAERLIKQAN